MIDPERFFPRFFAAALLVLAATLLANAGHAAELAKNAFGSQRLPAATSPESVGFYSKGCFGGGVAIAVDGPTWQSMRLSRGRRWGHPTMIKLIEKLSRDGVQDGWPGLLVGDISQPRGGPMLTGHASHQIGLDADIWMTPMPKRRLSTAEREDLSATLMIKKGGLVVDESVWTPAHLGILRRAASYSEVERILVHPGIKKKLCDTATGDRKWLRKVRPFWGHDYHFHIRIGCQAGSPGCKKQEAAGGGEGCDSALAWWFTEEPWRPSKTPPKPPARDRITLNDMPKACLAILKAPAPESEAAVTIGGGGMAQTAIPTTLAEKLAKGADSVSDTPETSIPVPETRPDN
ncbi:penicillin-insensitive murein endopeptidase [Mesorhizobium sp. NBSH29]|uniref:penicillin-insensitive murein endopeptidase n=1 Tax=Mesorhizobium sp. NBSH29 TaxID=2654249 RepID=UPI001896A521|nr:penicillin-insensitive murein endopeptidase [Mesorhizobium sp. NBSH29]QPC86286.1 penicillin-insensitive murein endopeptidase [Mesorhizobium sp. NBSH29]